MESAALLYDPLILNALAKEPTWRYALETKFHDLGLSGAFVQHTLKRLCQEGALSVTWDSQHRKIYSLTLHGRELMRERTDRLTKMVKQITETK